MYLYILNTRKRCKERGKGPHSDLTLYLLTRYKTEYKAHHYNIAIKTTGHNNFWLMTNRNLMSRSAIINFHLDIACTETAMSRGGVSAFNHSAQP